MILLVSKLGEMMALEYVLPSLHCVQAQPANTPATNKEARQVTSGKQINHQHLLQEVFLLLPGLSVWDLVTGLAIFWDDDGICHRESKFHVICFSKKVKGHSMNV